jgi:hypothetical protein
MADRDGPREAGGVDRDEDGAGGVGQESQLGLAEHRPMMHRASMRLRSLVLFVAAVVAACGVPAPSGASSPRRGSVVAEKPG